MEQFCINENYWVQQYLFGDEFLINKKQEALFKKSNVTFFQKPIHKKIKIISIKTNKKNGLPQKSIKYLIDIKTELLNLKLHLI